MNTDIRLSVGFWQHPKTKKTVKRLGLEGVRSLQVLWLWAAVNRPDGVLSGMDWEDIELAADWQGEERKFFDCCLSSGDSSMWIDVIEGGHILHDWAEHNPYVVEAEDRSDKARFSRLATVNRPEYERLKSTGVNAISKEDYDRLTTVKRMPDDRRTNVNAPPTPAPAPAPSPKPEEEDHTPIGITEKVGTRAGEAPGFEGTGFSAADFCGEALPEEYGPEPESGTSAVSGGLVRSEDPSIEFLELRAHYDAHGRPGDPLEGFAEYKALRASRTWPGQGPIYDGIARLAAEDDQWKRGFAPGLAKFLRQRVWERKPQARASPEELAMQNAFADLDREEALKSAGRTKNEV